MDPAARSSEMEQTAPVRPAGDWSRAKLVWFAVACTAVQLVIVVRLGRVPHTAPGSLGKAEVSGWVWDADAASEAVEGAVGAHPDAFVDDPRDPFQSVARSSVPKPNYGFAEWTAPPRWLTNAPSTPMVGAMPAAVHPRSVLDRPALDAASTLPLLAAQTTVSVGTRLVNRAWEKAPELGLWEGSELPGTTRLEVRVNPQGWVVLSRVVPMESSGLRAADEAARRAVLESRFKPLPGAAKRPVFDPGELTSEFVTVRWGTRLSRR